MPGIRPQVNDSGWDLTRTVKMRVTPGQVFRWGLVVGAGAVLLVEGVIRWLIGG